MSNESAVVGHVRPELFIGGKWQAARTDATFPVTDPATGRVLCEVADAGVEDGLAALDAAAASQSWWAARPPRERGEILRSAYELLLERIDDLALLVTLEMGKPLAEARDEVFYAAEFFRWFAEEGVRVDGGYAVPPSGNGRILTLRHPVGPCLLVTPWNFPLAMGTRKIGPAVAAGCTMVVKPAEQTPLSMLALADLLTEAGLPDGVLNVVTTSKPADLVRTLIRDPRTRKLSFTGSTSVGKLLLEQSAEQVLRVSLELGGNAPFLVFDDADLDAAVDGAIKAKLRNTGESCTAANRFHVHRSVAEEFSRRLADRLSGLRIGRGTEPDVAIGPLINQAAVTKVSELVQDATTRGAVVLTGGAAVDGPGHFYQPTVLTGVPPQARLLHEEIFGPVAAITVFDTEAEAIAMANDTPYGLAAYVYTRDLARALRVCERLDSGMIGLNQGLVSNPAAPFGGTKHSGLGREGGRVGIEEFLETKYVAVAQP
ncbi:NAD-dependent succinate-semialdehyde dehydrogenase [Streptomyces hygroscopicus]|uniref:NAD-dependent succinate-semialdehyde dehydrogenase n=1 Tax=Streptomyces hygroscopicus TaxID=1912 RepID=UPI003638F0DA